MNDDRLQKLFAFLESDPSDPFIKYALATEYTKRLELEKALSYFEDLMTNHEQYVGTYYHAGKLYEKLGRMEDAVKTYQKGMMVARESRDMHALSELQTVYLSATGQDYEDD